MNTTVHPLSLRERVGVRVKTLKSNHLYHPQARPVSLRERSWDKRSTHQKDLHNGGDE